MPAVGFEDEDDGSGDEVGLQDDGLDMDEGGKAYTMNCRMYENQFPEIDDVVMVQVRSIAEMGAYVCLLEYNNIEGMILLSELTRLIAGAQAASAKEAAAMMTEVCASELAAQFATVCKKLQVGGDARLAARRAGLDS